MACDQISSDMLWENSELRARIAELEAQVSQQRAVVSDARRALAESILRRYPLAWEEYNDRIFSTPRQAQEHIPVDAETTARIDAAVAAGRVVMPAPKPAEVQHVLYTNADADAPDAIKDRHGDVVLGLCKVCGQAEGDLEKQCPGPKKTPSEVGADDIAAWLDEAADYIDEWGSYASDYFKLKHDLEGDVAKYRERAKQARAQLAEGAEAWQRADNPPESEPGKWSRDVIAVTMSGDVFRIAHMGAAGGVWQRTAAMAELGDGGEVVAWIDSPEALIAAHSAGNAPRQTGESE